MIRPLRALVFVGVVGPLAVGRAALTVSSAAADITEAEVLAVRKAWGDAIVDIGKLSLAKGDFETRAGKFVDELYAFGVADIDVLFKPTMAEHKPFRTTREGALSYFIANAKADFPEDVAHGGFALKPWQAVRFEVAGSWYGPGAALSMGHYIFTDMNGTEHTAEFSFAYKRDDKGDVKLALHHSSFPFCGEEFVTTSKCMLKSSAKVAADMRSSSLAVQRQSLETVSVKWSAVREAEKVWGKGVVDLGKASAADVHDEALKFVAHSYAYSDETPYSPPAPWTGPGCLFKPTKARVIPFRTTLAGGASYFVGGDKNFAEDGGFALQPWTKVRFEAAGTSKLSDSLNVTMGHYFFTDTGGKEHKAEFSLAFVSGGAEASTPLIALHHSSFPFCSNCSSAPAAAPKNGKKNESHMNMTVILVSLAVGITLLVGIGILYKKYKTADSREVAQALIPKDDAC